MSILLTETTLIDAIKEQLGQKLKTVASVPGVWNSETLKRALIQAPGVYVLFAGAAAEAKQDAQMDGKWILYVVTDQANNELARRHGNKTAMGAYDIVQELVPTLHNLLIANVGSAKVKAVNNLYTGQLDKKGISLYAIVLSVPMPFDSTIDITTLDNFITYHQSIDIDPTSAGEPLAVDDVLLPQ